MGTKREIYYIQTTNEYDTMFVGVYEDVKDFIDDYINSVKSKFISYKIENEKIKIKFDFGSESFDFKRIYTNSLIF